MIKFLPAVPLLLAASFTQAAPEAPLFSAPAAIKVGWDAQAPFVADIDGDGRSDIAIIENDKARITLRYGLAEGESPEAIQTTDSEKWDPVLENTNHIKRWITTGVRAYDLTFADLNRDGLLDVIYSSERDQLVYSHQLPDREWSPPVRLSTKPLQNNWATLAIDQAEATRVALLTEDHLAVFQVGEGEINKPTYYPTPDECFHLQFVDVNADGAPDLVYQEDKDDEFRALVRLNQSDQFPVQQVLQLESPLAMVSYPLVGDQRQAVTIPSNATSLDTYALEESSNTLAEGETAMLNYSLGKLEAGEISTFSADYNLDGMTDLVICSGDQSHLYIFPTSKNGGLGAPVQSATVKGVEAVEMANLVPGGNLECVVFSFEENVIGFSTVSSTGSCPFPEELPVINTPTAMTTASLGEGPDHVLYLTENALHSAQFGDGEWTTQSTKIPSVGKRVLWMKTFDFDQDGTEEILILPKKGPLKVLDRTQPDVEFSLTELKEGFSEKLVSDLEPHQLSFTTTQEGRPALLVTRDNFVRALALREDGKIDVVQQLSLDQKESTFTHGVLSDVQGSDDPELLVYDRKQKRLIIGALSGERLATLPVPAGDIARLSVLSLDGQDGQDILCIGSKAVVHIPLGRELLQARAIRSHQSSIKDVEYHDYRLGDINGDAFPDAVVIDSAESHTLELLLGSENGFESHMHFVIYGADKHYRGRRGGDYQPSDFLIEDATSDGKSDLILHIHDRLLIYSQLP